MSRTTVHKTTHLHRMAFIGEQLYRPDNSGHFEPPEAKIQKGCRVAGAVLRAAEDPEEQDYLNSVLTPALLGAAWQDAFVDDILEAPNDLMYRVIELPRLDTDKNKEDFGASAWTAGVLHVEAAGSHQPFAYSHVKIDEHIIKIMRTRRTYRSMGAASLWLGTAPVARQIEAGSLYGSEVIQHHVRESGYKMTERALTLAHKIGVLPTIGQLDDAYSPLTVEFMRTGPSHLRERYQEARETTKA